jgi:hypothetical protein
MLISVHFYVNILIGCYVSENMRTQEFVLSSAEGLVKLECLDPKLCLQNFYMSSCFNVETLHLRA